MAKSIDARVHMLAIVLCDNLAQDIVTKRLSILGTVHGWSFKAFPAVLPSYCVYAAFTEVRGKVSVQLEIVDSEESLIHRIDPVELESPDEIQIVEAIAAFAGVKIPKPGHYFVRLLADGSYIMDRGLVITRSQRESS